MPAGGVGAVAAARGRRRRSEFVALLRAGADVGDAAKQVGWSGRTAYWKHRSKWADFKAECDSILAERPGGNGRSPNGDNEPGRAGAPHWDGTFGHFRSVFLGRQSAWFQVQAVNLIEEIVTAGLRDAGYKPTDPIPANDPKLSFGGQVILLLWPPEHGKTALWEDADTYLLSQFPWFLITVGSEKEQHSQKVLKFVRERFDDNAPGFEHLRERFGPFAPRTGAGRGTARQPWGARAFDVYKKPRGASRDYNMASIGMGGSVVGTRAHLLQVDDPQSRRSLNQTDQLVDSFRQDWLSRPGVTGFTVILMNRVGEDDFPSKLIEDGLVDNVVKVKAWSPDHGWAWPQRYSPGDYARLRRNVGEDAWERNYMQRGTPTKSMTFSDAHFNRAKNPLRSIMHPPPPNPAGGLARVGLGLDPGYGTTAITAGSLEPTRLRLLDCHALHDLTATNQIMAFLEDFLVTYTMPQVSKVEFVVVETKAFQKGLVNDDRYRELQQKFGFRTIPHLTGGEKTDEDIGIPQMAMSYLRGEIDIPDADDQSRARFAKFYAEHKKWRPYVSGAKLRQDRVMSTWFVWMYWRRLKRALIANPDSFKFRGLPSR